MRKEPRDIIMHRRVYAWIALFTGLILLVPLIAMQFTSEVSWDVTDFIVMGFLIFGAGSAFVHLSRKTPRKYRVFIGALVAAALFIIWAELAVGMFTSLGS